MIMIRSYLDLKFYDEKGFEKMGANEQKRCRILWGYNSM